MSITLLLQEIGIALLSGYLALSGHLSDHAIRGLAYFGITEPMHVTFHTPSTPQESTEIAEQKNSPYGTKDGIPKILLETQNQRASALEARNIPADQVSEALVNLFCVYKNGDVVRATSGSGVFIDPKGIILTNAHVAQFLLLGEFSQARCTVRQGNPARDRYTAELLYISSAWIHKNAALIDAQAPAGTGERDYALLYVTSALNTTLPTTFPYLEVDTAPLGNPARNSEVRVAGYPADILIKSGARADLPQHIENATITKLFSFEATDVDVIGISSSTVGERGSSGGPIVSKNGKVLGLIATKGNIEKEGSHSLRALTSFYINKTLKEETGYDLAATMTGDIPHRAKVFREALIPFLALLLKNEL